MQFRWLCVFMCACGMVCPVVGGCGRDGEAPSSIQQVNSIPSDTGPSYFSCRQLLPRTCKTVHRSLRSAGIGSERCTRLLPSSKAKVRLPATNLPPTPLNRACRAQGGEDASRRVTRADENAADILRAIECLAANVNEATTFLGKVGKTEEGCANNSPAVLPPGGFL